MKPQPAAMPPHEGCPPRNAAGLLKFRLRGGTARRASLGSTLGDTEQADLIVTQSDVRRGETLHLMELGIISAGEACRHLKLSRSQFYKLLAKYRKGGLAAIASRKRGRSSNRAYSNVFRQQVLAIIEKFYSDYGPTLAAELLDEVHGMAVSRETLRTWMTNAGIWIANRATRKRLHQPRKRMLTYGDLVQVDGSDHDWFEGRGPRCTAMVMVDDSTGRLQVLQFAPRENREAYFRATHSYVATHGKPVRIQTDKHSAAWSADGPTEYGKALEKLNIIHSVAHSPQSKGRVERCHRTLQDRLVKAFRREGICTIREANAFAPRFIEKYNQLFAKSPARTGDNHRTPVSKDEVDRAFSRQQSRRVTTRLTFSYGGTTYVIHKGQGDRDQIGRKVLVEKRLDGAVVVLGKRGQLKFDTIQ